MHTLSREKRKVKREDFHLTDEERYFKDFKEYHKEYLSKIIYLARKKKVSGRMNAYRGGGKRKQKIKRIIKKSIRKELQRHKRKRSQRSGLPIFPLVGGAVLG